VGALASSFSKFKHRIVEDRATEALKSVLGQTRLNLDIVLNNSSPSFEPTFAQGISESRVLRTIFWLVLLILIGRIARFTVGWKVPRSKGPESSRHSEKADFPGTKFHRGIMKR
jgi:hypothetical protein